MSKREKFWNSILKICSNKIILALVILLPILNGVYWISPYEITQFRGETAVGRDVEFIMALNLIILPGTCYWLNRIEARGLRLSILVSQAIGLILIFATLYRWYGLENLPPLLERDTAIYFSVVTWTTLGYGDLKPSEDVRLLAALEALIGYLYLGLIVGFTIDWLRPTVKRDDSITSVEDKKTDRTRDDSGQD